MTPEYPREIIEKVEKATFTMQEEIKEAEAAVDACYRRRARRAGLVEVLPEGRPMTERELDSLSELLGDRIGARARRRKEVEQMTLAEMEAELGGVQAEIKRRRSARAGWLPLMLMMILCISGHPAEGFTAYNCSNRSNIKEAYSLLELEACANMGKKGEVETTVYGEIVQIKQERMIPVFRCIFRETLISQYCGMFTSGTSDSGNPGHWRPGSAAKRGRAAKLSSTAGHSRARSGRQLRTACSWAAGLTMRASARLASLPYQVKGGVCKAEQVDGEPDLDLRGAGSGRRQEHRGQPRGNSGVGVRLHGLPANHCPTVQGYDEGVWEPDQHI
jgi:hypothetical protein